MANKIQVRRDTAANWASENPILSQGEPALETDTKKQKIGDGSTDWNSLEYFQEEKSNKIDAYRHESRVSIDGGITEDVEGLIPKYSDIIAASLVMLPHSYGYSVLYNQIPTQPYAKDFTFTRGSDKTRVNPFGVIEIIGEDTPSIDYSSGEGNLLLEPQSENLLPYSEDLTEWSWGEQTGGTVTVKSVTFGSSFNSRLFEGVSIIAGTTFTISCIFEKTEVGKTARLGFFDGNWDYGSNMLIPENGILKRTVTLGINDCQFIGLVQAVNQIGSETLNLPSETGGLQVEIGSEVSSYIPTNGSTVVRLADSCVNAGDLNTFNSEEGVMVVNIAALEQGSFRQMYINDGGTQNRVGFLFSSTTNQIQFNYYKSNVAQYSGSFILNDSLVFNEIAILWAQNNFKTYINGVLVKSATTGDVSSPNIFESLDFDTGDGTGSMYAKIKSLKVFKSIVAAKAEYSYIQ